MSHPNTTRVSGNGVDEIIEQRFAQYWAATKAGSDFTRSLRGRHDYGNPYLLESVQSEFGIDQYGTGMARAVWNPADFRESEYFEGLAAAQAEAGDAARVAASSRISVPFVSAGPQDVGLSPSAGSGLRLGQGTLAMRGAHSRVVGGREVVGDRGQSSAASTVPSVDLAGMDAISAGSAFRASTSQSTAVGANAERKDSKRRSRWDG